MPEAQIYFLIGMMGSGKSSIGFGVAQKLDFHFIDLDDYISKSEQLSISEIFETLGENGFRDLEKKHLRSLDFGSHQQVIVSTGGGTPAFNDNMEYMNEIGTTIWLETPINEIIDRLQDKQYNRPLLNGMDRNQITEQLKAIYEVRLPEFKKAKIRLTNSGSNYRVIEKLVELIKEETKKYAS